MKTTARGWVGALILSGTIAATGVAQTTAKPAAPKPAPVTSPAKPLTHDQILAAGHKYAKTPVISEASARNAAMLLLSANNLPVTDAGIQQLVVQLLQQADKDAAADIRTMTAEGKKNEADRKAIRASGPLTNEQTDALAKAAHDDQAKLQGLQDRKAQFEALLGKIK